MAALPAVLALAGCATPAVCPWPGDAPASADLRWPPPPAPARVAYVGELRGPAELGARHGWWRQFAGWITGDDDLNAPWTRPAAIAVAENGDLAVTDLSGLVDVIARDTRRHDRWRTLGTNELVSPVSVAFLSNRVFVADSALGRVIVVDRRGRVLREITAGLQRPTGLAVHDGALFVTDAAASSVLKFDADGRLLGRLDGGAGADLNRPTHVAVDAEGRVYVTDALNARVCVFAAGGRLERVIGRRGDGTGQFNRPKGVAITANGILLVADALLENLQLFDREGRFLLPIGGAGTGTGEFWLPTGVAAADDGTIFVADSFNERIQVLRMLGGVSP